MQRLTHHVEMPVQWRCRQLLAVSTGEQILGLIDILPATFDTIPETLDAASKRDIHSRLRTAVTVAAWSERTGHGPGAG